MSAETWYDLFPDRLVLEVLRVESFRPNIRLKRLDTILYWDCVVDEVPEGADFPPLHFVIYYPEAFPAVPPDVQIISPELSPSEMGHEWHRWTNGDICYVRPSRWQASTTADEIIKKVADWYFNYAAKKASLIREMPEIGRADLPAKKIKAKPA